MPENTDAHYLDARRPIDQRVDDLLGLMTLDEKLAQLGCVWSTQLVVDDDFSAERASTLMPHGTGHITRIAASTGLLADGLARFGNEIQRWLVEESRLGIPPSFTRNRLPDSAPAGRPSSPRPSASPPRGTPSSWVRSAK